MSFLAEFATHLLVVGSDIGLALRLRRIGVEGDDGDVGVARLLDHADDRIGVGDRDRDAVDPWVMKSCMICTSVAGSCVAGPL